MSNNYSAPSSTLVNTQGSAGSLEAAMAGQYEFGVMDTLSEAWAKTKGIKRYIIGAGILLYVILGIVLGIVMAIMMPAAMGAEPDPFAMLGIQLVLQPVMFAVMMPFVGGIVVMCLKHIQGREVAFGSAYPQLISFGMKTAGVMMPLMSNPDLAEKVGDLLEDMPAAE